MFMGSDIPLPVMTMSRAERVEHTVLNTSCDSPEASLNVPFAVTEASASPRRRSIAYMSMPVASITAIGVDSVNDCMSFRMFLAVVPSASSTENVVQPSPVSLAITSTSFQYLRDPALVICVLLHPGPGAILSDVIGLGGPLLGCRVYHGAPPVEVAGTFYLLASGVSPMCVDRCSDTPGLKGPYR